MRFHKFRIEDVRDQFIYACLFQTVTLAWRVIQIINGLTDNFVLLLAFQIIVAALYWTLYIFRNRVKENFMAVLMIYTVLYYVMLLTATELNSESKIETFQWGRVFMLVTVATNIMLLTPTISHGFLLYLPLHVLTILFMYIRQSVKKAELTQAAYACTCLVVFWYIYQKRELKRFYEKERAELKENKAIEKEVELENVLNLQQDAVVIFSSERCEELKANDSV